LLILSQKKNKIIRKKFSQNFYSQKIIRKNIEKIIFKQKLIYDFLKKLQVLSFLPEHPP